MQYKLKNHIILFIFTAFIGTFIGGLLWLFFKAFGSGTSFLWEWIPAHISFKGYPIVVCLVGASFLHSFKKIMENGLNLQKQL